MDAFNREDLCAQTQTLVLAGGRGERLAPLTKDRTKGAVPFAGSYRLIDFTLSNCLHSGLRRIAVLPQYKYASLERHLRLGWNLFRAELGEELALLPPQLRCGDGWYEGTADAVYQNAYALRQRPVPQALVLSSDHLYRMDYARLLDFHVRSGAELTIACMEVPLAEAQRFGVVDVATSRRRRSVADICANCSAPAVLRKCTRIPRRKQASPPEIEQEGGTRSKPDVQPAPGWRGRGGGSRESRSGCRRRRG